MSFVTNKSSRFTPFHLNLSNGATLTGISHIPPKGDFKYEYRPLLVAIHGGTCTSHNYDISPEYTASTMSAATGVPFVAFNRPGYADSTTLLPVMETTSYCQEEGRWNHENILPALWVKFGKPNGCTGIVVTCHSMAVLAGVVTGGLYAKDPAPKYPLAGLIFSGFGTRDIMPPQPPGDPNLPPPSKIYFPFAVKKDLMLGEENFGCADPALVPLLEKQDTFMHLEEMIDLRAKFFTYCREYSREINVPICYALGERDWLWEGTTEAVQEFMAMFPKCPKPDGGLVRDAPHALEWSLVSPGWYSRCFGWAIEVCASSGIRATLK